MLAVCLLLVALLVAVAVVSYLVSGNVGGTRRGILKRVARFIPLQSVKIVVVAWQILTQVRLVQWGTNPYSNVYKHDSSHALWKAFGRWGCFLV